MKITARSLFEIAGLKIPESLNTVKNEVQRAVDFIRENCSDSLWMFDDHNPTLLYAGTHKPIRPFVVQHPQPRRRGSVTNALLDSSPKPAGMPRRGWGVYAIPSEAHAAEFGTVSVIIPFDGAKIAATSVADFAEVESIWPINKAFSSGYSSNSWQGVLTALAMVSGMAPADSNNPDEWQTFSDRLEADPEFAATVHKKLIDFDSDYDWWIDDVVPLIQRGFLETVLNRVFRYDNMSDPYTVLTTKTLQHSHPGGETVIEGSVVRLSQEMFEMVAMAIADDGDDYNGVQESHNTTKITWTELKSEEGEERDALDRSSKWSRNTYGGADNLLYGEAWSRGALVGRAMIGVFDDFLEVDKLWVDPSVRRQGIGRQLISAAMDRTGVKKIVAPHTTNDGEAFVKSTFTGDDDGILKLRESHDESLSPEGLVALKAYTASGGDAEGKYRGTSRGRADFQRWLKSGLYKGKTVYRGLGFTDVEWDAKYKQYTTPGEVIQFEEPQSFTKNRTRASSYGSGPIQVRLYTNSLVGRDISKHSHYPGEEEVLMAGGEALEVVAAEYKAGGIWWIEVTPAN